jgi:hypothetical protein
MFLPELFYKYQANLNTFCCFHPLKLVYLLKSSTVSYFKFTQKLKLLKWFLLPGNFYVPSTVLLVLSLSFI